MKKPIAIVTLNVMLCLGESAGVWAQDASPVEAPTVVVTGTRVEQKSFDLPMAINAVGVDTIQGQGKPMANISEALNRVPGTVVQSREAFAQEQQITLRGFGARSQFGVRGIKLLADEIPASTPDGQGGTGLFDLASAKRIEVLRGPFSALYGNHSGGVVQIFTEDGPADPTLTGNFGVGSHDTWRAGLKFGGQSGDFNYIASTSRYDTEGYREHSSARKDQINAKLRAQLNDAADFSLVFNFLDQPENQDPLGLTAAALAANRRAVDTTSPDNALTFNTRRSLDNRQVGGVLTVTPSATDTLRLLAYLGERSNVQYLAIPITTQNGARHSGGVSAFDRDFHGAGLRWTHSQPMLERPLTLTLGVDYDRAEDDRKGYISNNGVQGALKRDENNTVYAWGVYGQGEWQVNEPVSVSAGLRYTRVNFKSEDRFIVGTNPDDSGSVRHDAYTPVAGVLYRLSPTLNLYANVGKSFETPTLIELAYRTDGGAGLNFGLRASRSLHYEVGAKALVGSDTRLDAAVFQIDTKDEITVFSNAGGRATFQNAGDTHRLGAELALDSNLSPALNLFLSATWLKAEFDDSFTTCVSLPCSATLGGTAPVSAGNRIPGVPRATLYAELLWRHPPAGLRAGVEARWADKVLVNDTNSAAAASYFVMNIHAGFEQRFGKLVLREFARVDNVLDKEYVGGVFVNDTNRRFFAPAAERTFFAGVSAAYAF